MERDPVYAHEEREYAGQSHPRQGGHPISNSCSPPPPSLFLQLQWKQAV
jgi:hypothetical protein